jgi:hypothetical protein
LGFGFSFHSTLCTLFVSMLALISFSMESRHFLKCLGCGHIYPYILHALICLSCMCSSIWLTDREVFRSSSYWFWGLVQSLEPAL